MIEFDKEKAIEIAKKNSDFVNKFFELPEVLELLNKNDFNSLLNKISKVVSGDPDHHIALMCILLLSGVDFLHYISKIPNGLLGGTPITKIDIPINIDSLGLWTFQYCSSLEYIEIPGHITEINNQTFFGCINLKEVSLFEGFKTLGWNVFTYCPELETVHLPSTLQSIDSYAFNDCTKLKEIEYGGTKAEWKKVKKSSAWRKNSAIYKVACVDGDLFLTK